MSSIINKKFIVLLIIIVISFFIANYFNSINSSNLTGLYSAEGDVQSTDAIQLNSQEANFIKGIIIVIMFAMIFGYRQNIVNSVSDVHKNVRDKMNAVNINLNSNKVNSSTNLNKNKSKNVPLIDYGIFSEVEARKKELNVMSKDIEKLKKEFHKNINNIK